MYCFQHHCNSKFSPDAGASVAPLIARTRLSLWVVTAKDVMLRCCGVSHVRASWHGPHYGMVHTHVRPGHHGMVHIWSHVTHTGRVHYCLATWLLTCVPDQERDNDQCYSLTRVTSAAHARYTRNVIITKWTRPEARTGCYTFVCSFQIF